MILKKSYKFRIYPNREQGILIQKTFGCVRFIYNHYLAKKIHAYSEDKSNIGYNACSADMTKLKKQDGFEWLCEVDSKALIYSLKNLDQAYKNFFRKIKQGIKEGFPNFKSKKKCRKSYRTQFINNNIKVYDKHIKLPKLGLVKCKTSRPIEGRILNVTVSQNPSGRYFVSVCCDDVIIQEHTLTGKKVGLDLGIKNLVTTSDNQIFGNPKYLKQSLKKLAKVQRQLSRKTKGSCNRNKARIKVAKLYEYITNQRLDNLHKLTTNLIKDYDVVCIEDLKIQDMISENTKKEKIRKKRQRINRSIYDASLFELKRQLMYKTEWHKKLLITIDSNFASSQLCSCGFKNLEVKNLLVRKWTCPNCGLNHDRDLNAATNILNEGLRQLQVA